jgi:hypothetical protein
MDAITGLLGTAALSATDVVLSGVWPVGKSRTNRAALSTTAPRALSMAAGKSVATHASLAADTALMRVSAAHSAATTSAAARAETTAR